MHGGSAGSGARRNNQNALKHGLYTRDSLAEQQRIQNLLRFSKKLLAALEAPQQK